LHVIPAQAGIQKLSRNSLDSRLRGNDEGIIRCAEIYINRMSQHPKYLRVFLTFARNSLVRDMLFPANFIIESISSFGWVMMNVGFYLLIFEYTDQINAGSTADGGAWDKYQFFVFISTSMFINSIVQMFFMTNADEFSELIRTGGLDFALLKPIDTQFLVSLRRVEWSSIANFTVAAVLMVYALPRVTDVELTVWQVLLYPLYVAAGVGILYSLTIVLAAVSVWLGRNTSIYDFWFYITTFSRYPMEIYQGTIGGLLRAVFTFVLPILVVVNVPARMLAKPLRAEYSFLAIYAIGATIVSLLVSRWVFQRSLVSYRSASS
jgi:ABC-2 type transport system permease protein